MWLPCLIASLLGALVTGWRLGRGWKRRGRLSPGWAASCAVFVFMVGATAILFIKQG